MTDLSGQTIREYQFTELIGSGGFGIVYRANQPSVDRQVAVKVIIPSRATSEYFTKRFDAEAHLVAKLEHPHIVPLYDYWHDDDGAGLVMRWLPGGSLQQTLQHGPLELPQVIRLVEQIGSALNLAHQQSVVHRDIKPANILLDNEGNFYLSDFGIAKDLVGDIYQSSGAGVTGSPAYLSPEQGLSETVTPLSDQYSFGVLLYEVLTGEHPFPDMATTAQILHHISDPLPSLLDIRPDLPAALDAVIQTATQKPPQDRFPDIPSLARAFYTALDTSKPSSLPASSPSTLPTSSSPAAPKQTRRSHSWLPLTAMVGVAFILLLVVVGVVLARPHLFPTSPPETEPTPIADQTGSTPSPTIDPTQYPHFAAFPIGESVEGRPLNALRIGTGPRLVVVIAALHGDEQNASSLTGILAERFQHKSLPEELTLYFLAAANPDGLSRDTRLNANGVDLNRNWATSNWRSETQGPTGTLSLGGGANPFSEPETIAISSWLLGLAADSPFPLTVLFYHSQYPPNGLVLPGYTFAGGIYRPDPRASLLGVSYAYAVGAEFSETWDSYSITGEALLWCGESRFICLDIELPSKDSLSASQILKHETALVALVSNTSP